LGQSSELIRFPVNAFHTAKPIIFPMPTTTNAIKLAAMANNPLKNPQRLPERVLRVRPKAKADVKGLSGDQKTHRIRYVGNYHRKPRERAAAG
jgi:hypothetical protein